jgi:protein involved in polysaccharide export with SLBB domain
MFHSHLPAGWASARSLFGFAAVTFTLTFSVSCSNNGGLVQPSPEDFLPPAVSIERVVTPTTPLKPGDNIEIYVTEDTSLNGNHVVRREGHILLTGFGRFSVAGLSPSQAEAKLKAALEKSKLRVATVIIDRVLEVSEGTVDPSRRILVYLTGKVARPGQHALIVEPGKSIGIYQAIMITGGMDRFANPKKAYVVRATREDFKRNIALDLEKVAIGDSPDLPVHPGDVVVVPEKTFGF